MKQFLIFPLLFPIVFPFGFQQAFKWDKDGSMISCFTQQIHFAKDYSHNGFTLKRGWYSKQSLSNFVINYAQSRTKYLTESEVTLLDVASRGMMDKLLNKYC